ncbi:calexcitin-1 isoform X2 [Octopus sinensis]|uniref:Calexcitin-1 isoform X2 n=1 Tax=Octopus sinensis TaxID=2607531 RepID=A0A7E6FKQ2_9MOLL|nr:calexcitin-1 isoform X2 [Octopus sinensis]
MGNETSSATQENDISSFRKEKLLHEFHTFFDFNKSGYLDWKDFDLCRQIKMWTNLALNAATSKKSKIKDRNRPPPAAGLTHNIPDWLDDYIEYRFSLYDRTRDGIIDIEEFEYVLSDFGVPAKDARTAFIIFSKNQEKVVDLEYFKELSFEYFQSDEPSDLGNFITGRLNFLD